MPKIIINEQELTTFAQFNATENSVLIPLFVTTPKDPGRYTSIGEFKKDFPVGTVTVAQSAEGDSEGVRRATVAADGVISYWKAVKTTISGSGSSTVTDKKEVVFFDKSYLMICELLARGMIVIVDPILHAGKFADEQDAIDTIQADMPGSINNFKDKNLWNIKFITSGAYPNAILGTDAQTGNDALIGCYTSLRGAAEARGDCISLLEFEEVLPFDYEGTSQSSEDLPTLKKVIMAANAGSKYTTSAAGLIDNQGISTMPACFGYLLAVAANAANNISDWLANSGTIRGRVPNLGSLEYTVGEALMHYLQCEEAYKGSSNSSLAINPIMPVGTYGTRIWGNRTTFSAGTTDSYSNFLNVRILLCDIKKQLYHASLRITFEPNDDIAWINFKKLNNTLLDQMQSGRGIQWYRWKKLITDQKATLKALLTIKPIEALEYFDITVSLAEDGTAEVEEM